MKYIKTWQYDGRKWHKIQMNETKSEIIKGKWGEKEKKERKQ